MNTAGTDAPSGKVSLDNCVQHLISLLEEWVTTSEEILGGLEDEKDGDIDIIAITHCRDLLMPRIAFAVSEYTQLIRTTGMAPDAGLLDALCELSARAEAKDVECIEFLSSHLRRTGEGLGCLKTARRVGGAYLKRASRDTARFLDTDT